MAQARPLPTDEGCARVSPPKDTLPDPSASIILRHRFVNKDAKIAGCSSYPGLIPLWICRFSDRRNSPARHVKTRPQLQRSAQRLQLACGRFAVEYDASGMKPDWSRS